MELDSFGIELIAYPINNVAELEKALGAASASGADSLFVIASRMTNFFAAKIAKFGEERQLSVIALWREFATAGALLSYGPSRVFEAKRLAGYKRL